MVKRIEPWLVCLVVGGVHTAVAQESQVTINDLGGELLIEVGPIDLPASADADHGHHGIFPPVATVSVPTHGYLYGFDYDVVDAQGNELPTDIVHHFNLIDPDHQELFLPISQRMMAAGKETGAQSMPWMLFGYPVYVGQRVVVSAMLHNPTSAPHNGVSLRIRLKYVDVGRPWPFFEVYPFQLDVAFPAGDKSFDLPPGRSSRSYDASPAMEGRMMVIGSHLHENATNIVFEDVTANRVIWEGFPVEENGRLTGVTMGRLYRKGGVKVFPDHTYRVTVFYENPTDDVIAEGGMGVVAGVFMPSRGGAWPRVDVSDPLYALDREHYMRVVRGKYDVIKEGGGVIAEGDAGEQMEGTPAHVHN
jgi:hypothetical protein